VILLYNYLQYSKWNAVSSETKFVNDAL